MARESRYSSESRSPSVAHSRDRLLAARPRWNGRPDRLEVWYATFTDLQSRAGGWVHCEIVAPRDDEARAHGWFAWFPTDGPPLVERFDPVKVPRTAGTPAGLSDGDGGSDSSDEEVWFDHAGVRVDGQRISGATASLSWDLAWEDATPPLWTFPKEAWSAELLPGAQVVVAPSASFRGTVELSGEGLEVDARGGLAHIFGHGNAKRWAWLHADLSLAERSDDRRASAGRSDGPSEGSDSGRSESSDVVELVTAVSRSPGLDRLPPTAFLRMRVDGEDWPTIPVDPRLRSEIGLPDWSVSGRVGSKRVRILVHQPPERTVSLDYQDPDGAHATCHNSEVADALVTVEERRGGRWVVTREWELRGVAHAEVGLRDEEG